MTKKLIPFYMMPSSWGLKGKSRDVAEAEYSLSGFELESRLLDINFNDLPAKDLAVRRADAELKYNKITKIDHLRKLAEMIADETQRKLALLELDFKEKKISDTEYDKQMHTLNNQPWVSVLKLEFGGSESLEGGFELDWNDQFIEHLEASGYHGHSPEGIVNHWFMTVCKNIALEEFDGTGTFTADAEANVEAVKRWGASAKAESISDNRRGYK